MILGRTGFIYVNPAVQLDLSLASFYARAIAVTDCNLLEDGLLDLR